MGNNKRAFFELVKVGMWGKNDANLDLNEKIDLEKVYQLAQEQSAQGVVLHGIETLRKHNDNLFLNIPQALLLQWIGVVQMIEQRNKEMNAFIADLFEKLRKENIRPILVKGQGVALCYEKPFLRTCGDVDLFLSEEDYNRTKAFLMPLASRVETEHESSKHMGMTLDGWTVELHGSLRMGLPRRINDVLDDIKSETFNGGNVRTWDNDGTQVFMLGKENDAVYVFAHFFNHFYKGGLGLRQICDWCRLLWTYRDTLDVMKVESLIRRMGLVSEWKAFAALAVNDLGMPAEAMPMYDNAAKWSRKAERIKAFVLSVGNFGHNRDMSYYGKYPFLVRKCISMGQRVGDLLSHARIFPLNSLRFFPSMLVNGVRSAVRGEG